MTIGWVDKWGAFDRGRRSVQVGAQLEKEAALRTRNWNASHLNALARNGSLTPRTNHFNQQNTVLGQSESTNMIPLGIQENQNQL